MKISYNKEIPFYGSYDIAVIGGGPSGVCAAISAARGGAKVILIESTGMLGGMATSGLVGPFMTCYDRDGDEKIVSGIFDEIIARLAKYSAVIPPENVDSPSLYSSFIIKYHRRLTPFNPFFLQIVLDDMVNESGVEVLCYTQFCDCITENGNIKYVIASALEGLISISAKQYIDATGIASVADCAGVPSYKGEEINGIPQPGTLMFEVNNVNDEQYNNYNARPEYPVKAFKMPINGTYKVNHYHVFNIDSSNAKSMTVGHQEARKQVLDAFAVLKNKTPGFENANISNVASMLGVRECRHVKCEYTITVDDVSNGTKFEDTIAVYGYGMDVHARSSEESGNFKIEVAKRYYIPYRCMVPVNCNNLLIAGKTISCESQAIGGIRCMPCIMSIGQAAGTAAALAVKNNVSVRNVDIKALQNILLNNGAILD